MHSQTILDFHQSNSLLNNGAAGAPYYAQEKTPWSDHVEGFIIQNALVIFYVNGNDLKMKVLNPDTL